MFYRRKGMRIYVRIVNTNIFRSHGNDLHIGAVPREKNNIVDLKHAAEANPDRHVSLPVDFLFQESLLYTPDTKCVGPDQSVRTAQADLNR